MDYLVACVSDGVLRDLCDSNDSAMVLQMTTFSIEVEGSALKIANRVCGGVNGGVIAKVRKQMLHEESMERRVDKI